MKAVRGRHLFAYISLALVVLISLISLPVVLGRFNVDNPDAHKEDEKMYFNLEEVHDTTAPIRGGDLVPAIATNGQEGYVLKPDLDKATGLWESDEELAARISKAVPLFQESLRRHLPDGFEIDDASAREVIEVLRGGLASPEYLAKAASIVRKAAPAASYLALEELESNIQEALLETDEELTVLVPVYLEDGQTWVGYLPVSTL